MQSFVGAFLYHSLSICHIGQGEGFLEDLVLEVYAEGSHSTINETVCVGLQGTASKSIVLSGTLS